MTDGSLGQYWSVDRSRALLHQAFARGRSQWRHSMTSQEAHVTALKGGNVRHVPLTVRLLEAAQRGIFVGRE